MSKATRLREVIAGAVVASWLVAATAVATVAHARDKGPAAERGRVAQWSAKLKSEKDFRVRTQAALALGASGVSQAVAPLCGALSDRDRSVRAAAAAALGKLRQGGASCLTDRRRSEPVTDVRKVIDKALADLSEGDAEADGEAQPPTASTKYYLAIGKITDESGRAAGAVDRIVRSTMAKALRGASGYALAPGDEAPGQAKAVLRKFKQMKGFFLWPKVMAPEYVKGTLVVRVELAIFTYPAKALRGSLPVKLTMPDVGAKDERSEDELIALAAERVVQKFSENAERL